MTEGDRSDSPADGALDLVRFFRELKAEARRAYEALAARDREFGEDVAAERCAQDAAGETGAVKGGI